eukprot:1185914-Prorocentrum_minimum.AAC.4
MSPEGGALTMKGSSDSMPASPCCSRVETPAKYPTLLKACSESDSRSAREQMQPVRRRREMIASAVHGGVRPVARMC